MILPDEFYPTPPDLANKMMSKVNFNIVENALEPSAGDGDLADAMEKAYSSNYWRSGRKLDIDCVEIDKNLQRILIGKEYRVIHDNFLTLQTYKRYSLIAMNPPFSDGAKHLLKSIEMQQDGGQIVCLLNAETLRNTFTNERKVLLQKLSEYGAEVQYMNGAFSTSERKTNVEIALVYINIPHQNKRSDILEHLTKEKELESKGAAGNEKLAKGDAIESLIDQFNFEVRVGIKLIDEYNTLSPSMLTRFDKEYERRGNEILSLKIGDKDATANELLRVVRYKYWETLFQSDKFSKLFTENLRKEYMGRLEDLRDYDFNSSNICQMLIDINKQMLQSLNDTIIDLFDKFSYQNSCEKSGNIHYYNGWKTNKAYIVNKRIVVSMYGAWNNIFDKFSYTTWDISHKLQDIEKVFNYLDNGHTEEIDLIKTLRQAESIQQSSKIHLKYFDITFYKKGTAHLEFTNLEVLKKFNIFGSQHKGWLPPCYGKASYNEMNSEEQAVINEFEGKEEYCKVKENNEYYLFDTSTILMLSSGRA